MKVTLKLEEDGELREAIKGAIKGQAKSIIRSEITTIMGDVLEAKLKTEIQAVIAEFKNVRMIEILFEAFDLERGEFQRHCRERAYKNMRKEISDAGANIMRSIIENKYPDIEADIRESLKKSIIERLAK